MTVVVGILNRREAVLAAEIYEQEGICEEFKD